MEGRRDTVSDLLKLFCLFEYPLSIRKILFAARCCTYAGSSDIIVPPVKLSHIDLGSRLQTFYRDLQRLAREILLFTSAFHLSCCQTDCSLALSRTRAKQSNDYNSIASHCLASDCSGNTRSYSTAA